MVGLTSLAVGGFGVKGLDSSGLLNLESEVEKLRSCWFATRNGSESTFDRENVEKQALLAMVEEYVRCEASEDARDIDKVFPSAALSSVARAQERMPTTAVAVGHMMASREFSWWRVFPFSLVRERLPLLPFAARLAC